MIWSNVHMWELAKLNLGKFDQSLHIWIVWTFKFHFWAFSFTNANLIREPNFGLSQAMCIHSMFIYVILIE